MFDNHKTAVILSGEEYISLFATRGYADGETFDVLLTDWSNENLECVIALAPDHSSLVTLPVICSLESKTWQALKDECVPVEQYMPCDASLGDTISVTEMTVAWSATSLDILPKAQMVGHTINLYLEIRRADGVGPLFASGDFIVKEKIH